jgi:hypothetical protein
LPPETDPGSRVCHPTPHRSRFIRTPVA